MKKRIYLSISVVTVVAIQALAQSTSVKIIFKNAPPGVFTYQLPSTDDHILSIRVPKTYAPSVEAPSTVAVSRSVEGDSFVFSFSVPTNVTHQVRSITGGLEIMWGTALAASTPQAAVVPTPNPTTGLMQAAATASNSPLSQAQEAAVKEDIGKQKIDKANVDMNIPESPGFTILGLTPEAIIRPTSPRQFVTTLLNGVDMNGNFQSGVAIDTAPFLLLYGNNFTINEYRTNYLKRLLTRTQLSLATVKGASEDDKSAKLGLGLHLTLYDAADPRMDDDLEKCFIRRFASISTRPISPLDPNREQLIKQKTEQLQKAAEECRSEWKERSLGKTSWIVGTAGSWFSPTGETKNFNWNGGAFWTSFSLGINQNSQLILHLRHRTKEQVPNPEMEGAFFEKDTTLGGARLRFGRPSFAGNLETVFTRDKRIGVSADNNFRLSAGAERKIADNLYFSLSVGGETKRNDGTGNKAFILTSFKWGYRPAQNQPTN